MRVVRVLDLPPVWAAGMALISWVLARLFPFLSLQSWILGGTLAALGLALIIWSALWFFAKRTPIEPRHKPRALIVEGPFRINRNPIYTGMMTILAGYAFWLGPVLAFLPVVVFPLIITRRFIRAEEAALRARFGPAAEAYIARSRRW